jgi:hypothetical protein
MDESDPHAKLRHDFLERISAPDVIPVKYRNEPERLPDLVDRLDQICELRYSSKDPHFRTIVMATAKFAILAAAGISHEDRPFAEACSDYLDKRVALGPGRTPEMPPREIDNSLNEFRREYPSGKKTAFIVMRFVSSQAYSKVLEAIRTTLSEHGIVGLRADDKQYHDDLYYNILTYAYGCSFSVAVFERIETEEFNPNVSFEVGYAMAVGKQVCLLKDKTLQTLHTDLMGKLYREFDPHDPMTTIRDQLGRWISERIG